MKLELTAEGAQALRDFADALPPVLDELSYDTEQLIETFRSVSDDLGTHEENFNSMLRSVARAQKAADEAIQTIPEKMRNVAQAIEDYVRSHPSI